MAVGLGGLFAVGAVIAALFEVQRFSRAAEEYPRPEYLIALAVGFAASLVIPALLARWLFPQRAGRTAVAVVMAVVIAGVVYAVTLGGMSLSP